MADTARKTTSAIKGVNGTLAQSYDEVKRKINELESAISKSTSVRYIREARRELESLQKISLRHAGNTDRGSPGFLAGMIRSVLPAASLAGLLAVGGTGFSNAMSSDSINRAVNFATNGQGTQAVSSVKAINDKYGLNDQAGLEGFKTLAGSVRSLNIPLSETLRIYESVGAAGRAMGVDAEAQKGIFLALGQIASKGTVSAEELRGQIGERLPGAFGIAAKAMGVSEQKLGDMMKQGELLSKDFLPRFATEMQNTFGVAALKAVQSPAAIYERFNNTLYAMSVTLGETLLPPLTSLMQTFMDGVQYVKEHQTMFEVLGIALLSAAAGYYAVTFAMRAGTIATTMMAGAQTILNFVMSMNPIGAVIAAIAALVAVVIYAWNKFGWFRGAVLAMWETMKGFGLMIQTYVVDKFKALVSLAGTLGEAIAKLFSGDVSGAWQTAKKGIAEYNNAGAQTSARIKEQFNSSAAKVAQTFYGEMQKGDTSEDASSIASGNDTFAKPSAVTLKDSDETVKGITGGGPRVININGVRFADKIEIHTTTLERGLDGIKDQLDEYLLRLLNSGAAVQ